jgi:hypothetical protein
MDVIANRVGMTHFFKEDYRRKCHRIYQKSQILPTSEEKVDIFYFIHWMPLNFIPSERSLFRMFFKDQENT